MYIIFIHTLCGHFVLGTLFSVPGLNRFFYLQNFVNSLWHRFNKVLDAFLEILVHINKLASHSCCRLVGCTSIM